MALLTTGVFSRFRPARGGTAALLILLAAFTCFPANGASAKACVWKVTSGDRTLYLAGSIHALRGADYPLPAAYEQAFQASSTLAFELDPGVSAEKWNKIRNNAELFPKGTTLRDHLDPRVYQYLQKVVANAHGGAESEQKLDRLRPWAIAWRLESPGGIDGVSHGEGVEAYLTRKAIRAHKKMKGLVPVDEHMAVFGGMSDADSQAVLLLAFIGLDRESAEFKKTVTAWKRGDIDAVDRIVREDYGQVPSVQRRIITDRNRRWLPEIIQWLQSGETTMVVAGTAHMAGSEGLPALLKAQGFQVEQL